MVAFGDVARIDRVDVRRHAGHPRVTEPPDCDGVTPLLCVGPKQIRTPEAGFEPVHRRSCSAFGLRGPATVCVQIPYCVFTAQRVTSTRYAVLGSVVRRKSTPEAGFEPASRP